MAKIGFITLQGKSLKPGIGKLKYRRLIQLHRYKARKLSLLNAPFNQFLNAIFKRPFKTKGKWLNSEFISTGVAGSNKLNSFFYPYVLILLQLLFFCLQFHKPLIHNAVSAYNLYSIHSACQ